jgi:asparaginyl-tRNA synthetase
VATLGEFDEAILKRVTTGASLKIVGTVVESLGKGQSVEVKAKTIEILGFKDKQFAEKLIEKSFAKGR